MKSKIVGLLAVALLASPIGANAFQYDVNLSVGNGSATGTITTDGTIGSLASANIADWNILLNDGLTTFNLFGPLSGNNSAVLVAGAGFVASSANLTFDFSGSGYALFQNPSTGSGINYLCFAANQCGGFANAINLATSTFGSDTTAQSGVQIVATRSSAVPEPGTLALLGLGLAGLGLSRRRLAA